MIARCLKLFPVLLACSLVGASVLPIEHAHTRNHHDDHDVQVVHRHLEPHHSSDSTTVDAGDDQDVVWIDVSYLVPAAQDGVVVLDAVLARATLPAPVPASTNTPSVLFAAAHDPPSLGTTGLRAPPPSVQS